MLRVYTGSADTSEQARTQASQQASKQMSIPKGMRDREPDEDEHENKEIGYHTSNQIIRRNREGKTTQPISIRMYITMSISCLMVQ